MKRTNKLIILICLLILLVAELGFIRFMHLKNNYGTNVGIIVGEDGPTEIILSTEPAPETEAPTEEPTEAPTETEPEETEAPTEEETGEKRFLLSFVGDCTLGSTAAKSKSASSFIQTIGTDYEFPFANVVEYFEKDDFTIANLEGPLTETGRAAQKTFAFKGPTAYTQILTSSSVEAVTLANNHAQDYGTEGYKNTVKALNEAGVSFVEKDDTTLLMTESGLKIGLYAASFDFNKSDMISDIGLLRQQGAEIVICAFHWGTEGAYRPNGTQEYYGRAAIEAGADIVYGSHPHVLQKVEQYQDGYIFYSLGNFSFGGSVFPQDYDSAILQLEVIRDEEGVISLGELTMIPVSISSMKNQNNFQPTPLVEGTKEYDRAMSKLTGEFKGPNLVVDYDSITGDKDETTPPTESGSSETTAPTTGGETSAPTTAPTTGPTNAPTTAPDASGGSGSTGDSSSGDSGSSGTGSSGGSSGSDSGSSGGTGGSSGGDGGVSEG